MQALPKLEQFLNKNASASLTALPTEIVKEIQSVLDRAGYPLAVDGIVGAQTKHAFKRFKEDRWLGYPDLVGESTLIALKQAETQPIKPLSVSQKGLNLIKSHEGCRLNAYYCPAGVLTIGYGHTGNDVYRGKQISPLQAEELLRQDLRRFEQAVNRLVRVPLTQGQFDALVSFTFNCGETALSRSTLLKKLNAGDYAGAVREFDRWTRGGGKVLPGLVRRRNEEQHLFLS